MELLRESSGVVTSADEVGAVGHEEVADEGSLEGSLEVLTLEQSGALDKALAGGGGDAYQTKWYGGPGVPRAGCPQQPALTE